MLMFVVVADRGTYFPMSTFLELPYSDMAAAAFAGRNYMCWG
jgi:hypothetical protein